MPADDYKRVLAPGGAIYLTTVGYGTGALLGRGIKRVREVHWLDELGIAQAMWLFDVENFGPSSWKAIWKGIHCSRSTPRRSTRASNGSTPG